MLILFLSEIYNNFNYFILNSSKNTDVVEHREFCGFENDGIENTGEQIYKSMLYLNDDKVFIILLFFLILLILKNYKYLNYNSIGYSDELLTKKDAVINKIIIGVIFILIIFLLLKNHYIFLLNRAENTADENYAWHYELDGCGGLSLTASLKFKIIIDYIAVMGIFIIFMILLFLKKKDSFLPSQSQNINISNEIKSDNSDVNNPKEEN